MLTRLITASALRSTHPLLKAPARFSSSKTKPSSQLGRSDHKTVRPSSSLLICRRGVSGSARTGSSRIPRRQPGDFTPITWRTLAVTFSLAAGGIYYLQQEKKAMNELIEKREAERQAATYGKPQVGGPFELVDSSTGKTVTDADFHGRFPLIYFGFTHCPDVCPDELEKVSKAILKVDTLPDVGPKVVPIFISVDPQRDTPKVVEKYIKEFHPRFVGLTGTEENVAKVAKSYRVYISRGEATPGAEDTDYLVDHSIFFFLMDPTGSFLDFFGRNATADEIAAKLVKHVREYERDQKAGRLANNK